MLRFHPAHESYDLESVLSVLESVFLPLLSFKSKSAGQPSEVLIICFAMSKVTNISNPKVVLTTKVNYDDLNAHFNNYFTVGLL